LGNIWLMNIVPITFFILFLLFIEDRICKKDIHNYRIWQSSSHTKPQPDMYSETLSAKILSFLILVGLTIWVIAFIVFPVARYIVKFFN